ncbi:MAG: zinc-ribbon domain-containing protein [Proteobacteria bacterium]|nr:zinc-ribbon domain-containing protein [Pseudomonadota bacterium]
MQIVCPNCSTAYDVSAASLGERGRSVRCVRCRNIWVASAPALVEATPEAAAGEFAMETTATGNATHDPAPDGLEQAESAAGEQVVDHAPPLAPGDDGERHIDVTIEAAIARAVPAEPADIESVTRRRESNRAGRWRLALGPHGLAVAILVLVAIHAALVSWRAGIVRVLPQTGSLYALIGLPVNLRGLSFADVKSLPDTIDGVPVLVVEGRVVNAVDRPLQVPRMRFSVRTAGGGELYAWTLLPTRTVLGPGEGFDFRTRLASPPANGRDVMVRFFHRRDLAAGLN